MKRNTADTQAQRLSLAIRHRQEREKQELRQAILAAAGELFLEQGYERFSMRKVAERIGYSPTTIYLYFRDKDDLLFTVIDDGFVRFGQQLALAAESHADAWERLIALGRTYVAFGLEHPVYYQLMFMQRVDFLTHTPSDAESYSDVLWALVHGMVSLAISMPMFDTARIQRTMETAWQMECQGLKQH